MKYNDGGGGEIMSHILMINMEKNKSAICLRFLLYYYLLLLILYKTSTLWLLKIVSMHCHGISFLLNHTFLKYIQRSSTCHSNLPYFKLASFRKYPLFPRLFFMCKRTNERKLPLVTCYTLPGTVSIKF